MDEREAEARRYYGKYPAIVVDNGPPEGGEHRGELRVEVPGILEETPDGKGNRALLVTAAPCFPPGLFYVPENKATVWVEFAAGDLDFPIWTGVWYAKGAAPRTTGGAAPTSAQKLLRSASGHLIELDDTAGAAKLVVQHAGGMDKGRITLDGRAVSVAFGAHVLELGPKGLTLDGKAVLLEALLDWLTGHKHVGAPSGMLPVSPDGLKDLAPTASDKFLSKKT